MSPFLYTALPALHKLDPDKCVQSVVSLKNRSVGLSCDFPLGAGFLLHLERHMTDQQIYIAGYAQATILTVLNSMLYTTVSFISQS